MTAINHAYGKLNGTRSAMTLFPVLKSQNLAERRSDGLNQPLCQVVPQPLSTEGLKLLVDDARQMHTPGPAYDAKHELRIINLQDAHLHQLVKYPSISSDE